MLPHLDRALSLHAPVIGRDVEFPKIATGPTAMNPNFSTQTSGAKKTARLIGRKKGEKKTSGQLGDLWRKKLGKLVVGFELVENDDDIVIVKTQNN